MASANAGNQNILSRPLPQATVNTRTAIMIILIIAGIVILTRILR